jgi:hypothetical protein
LSPGGLRTPSVGIGEFVNHLGLPESDFPRMLRLTQELFGADDPDFARVDLPKFVHSVFVSGPKTMRVRSQLQR